MTPFVKVFLEGTKREDLSDYVESFTYEDEVKKDNMLELKINPDRAIDMLDDKEIEEGAKLSVQFGFLGQDVSKVINTTITDIEGTYKAKLSLVLRCLDKGNRMKKTTSTRVWNNKTSSEIAQDIATMHGLAFDGVRTSKVWECLPQSNKSDFDFLKYLATREKDGTFLFYVRNDVLYFTTIALPEESIITYTYAKDERFVGFVAKYKKSSAKGEGNQSMFAGLDPKSKQVKGAAVDNTNKKNDTLLGSTEIQIDNFGNEAKKVIKTVSDSTASSFKGVITGDKTFSSALSDTSNSIMKSMMGSVPSGVDLDELSNIGNSVTKHATRRVLTGDLDLEGNPALEPNKIITLSGMAKRHNGNWLITKVKHSISNGGAYLTRLELEKNATKSGTKTASTDKPINNTVGDTDVKTERRVYFGINGNESGVH